MIDSARLAGAARPAGRRVRLRRLRLSPLTWTALVMLAALVFASAFGPLIVRHDPVKTDLINSLQPPSAAHPLGTDNFGRDLLSRLLYAARVDLQIMTVPTAAS